MRIVIVGTSGSGKTTLAKKIAERLGIPRIELDALNWEPNWVQAPKDVFYARVDAATSVESWVTDGNYGNVRNLTWSRADILIWLDYPFHIVFARVFLRTLHRLFFRDVLWNGNRETFRMVFFSKESILLWVLQTFWRRRQEYPALLALPQFAQLKVLHFKKPSATEEYLKTASENQFRSG